MEHLGPDGAFLEPIGVAVQSAQNHVTKKLLAAVRALEMPAGEDTIQFLKDSSVVQIFMGKNSQTGFDMQVNSPDSTLVFSKVNKSFSGISGSAGVTYNFNEQISMKANMARRI